MTQARAYAESLAQEAQANAEQAQQAASETKAQMAAVEAEARYATMTHLSVVSLRNESQAMVVLGCQGARAGGGKGSIGQDGGDGRGIGGASPVA